ncbi:FadR/GntR family transcriptional regulator [Frankia sp. QA3]|uniref:FadR/GntR family transcriptional regulator n=1 Tax=Frankia sp. QA3 TaxID=710111 RepID=UPI000269CA7D|nr:FCD domain-containing protein [Frankia sp. QA3]EIV94914.1 transcriptional regulator [Frankia sp. QA3]
MPSTDRLVESARGPAISVRHPPRGEARGKLAAQVAWRIEDDIVRAGWPVGAVIGSEPTLIERYKVSRAVFREAVRIVEHHQVATMRRGPSGGLIVRAPDEVAVTTALGVYLEYVGVTIESILRARFIIESLAATLAPARITEDGIRTLREIIARRETADPTEFGSHHQLHHAIAAATGNPVLVLFVDVLNSLTFRYAAHRYATTHSSASPARRAQVAEEVHRNHAAIAEAVIGGDAARAQHLAAVHLEAMHEWMTVPPAGDGTGTGKSAATDESAGVGGRRIRPREPGLGAGPGGTMPPGKLAETVAGRIRDDVARDGVPVGVVIGSESELLARYGVSRAVLREAVRLLEYHSVAQMRRGPGGGLVVTEPDPAATVEATALYLEYSQASVDDLRIVRDALELSCVDILIERRGPELTARLEALLTADAGETPRGPVDAGHHLHMELARLTGNEALASFVRVLTAIWRRHVDGSRPTPAASGGEPATGGCGQPASDARAAHRGIIDAIIAGDRGLARHRMRRHLEALSDWWR